MKFFLIISVFLCLTKSKAQDSTYRCVGGMVEVKKIGISKNHTIESERNDKEWISGKVKRVDYEYTYTRTYNGSTRPANPEAFYKPIKAKSFYFVPIEDVVIMYGLNGPLYQTFSKDSLHLKTYYKDGALQAVYYLNEQLQVDSLYRFYENGELKTRIVGSYSQVEDNLVLSLDYHPEMKLRRGPAEWTLENRSYLHMPIFSGSNPSWAPFYPLKQDYCHGNGKPQIVITWHSDTLSKNAFHKTYEFFDPDGNKLDSNSISAYGRWTGLKYSYYKTGVLESISNLCEDHRCGIFKRWNDDGTLNSIDYLSKSGRDSIVYYKQLDDTLLSWKPPVNFKWGGQYDSLIEVSNAHCKLGFNNDGSVRYTSFDGSIWESYRTYRDEKLQLTHSGHKDSLGFPHGRWYGLNGLKDTVYVVNYHHGYLHGEYRVTNTSWESNWLRTYKMGVESDSSVLIYKGKMHEVFYFSDPGKIVKKARYNNQGSLWFVDTLVSENNFFRILSVTQEGWSSQIGHLDTSKQVMHTTRFYAPGKKSTEYWTDLRGVNQESKEYYPETGTIKVHLKNEGQVSVVDTNAKPSETPKHRIVKLAYRWSYNENGALIKKERLENGVVVEGN